MSAGANLWRVMYYTRLDPKFPGKVDLCGGIMGTMSILVYILMIVPLILHTPAPDPLCVIVCDDYGCYMECF